MKPLPEAIVQTLADPLRSARVLAESGKPIVGFVGSDAPFELALAAGAIPVALPSFAHRPTPRADEVLEPRFTPAARSIVDQWLAGELDFLQSVVFSRGDDSTQRSYYYLCELQRTASTRGPRPLLFDIAKIPRASSIAHTQHAMCRLASELGSDLSRLPSAIETRNARRTLLAQLISQRAGDRPPLGSLCEQLLRAADVMPAAHGDDALREFLARASVDAGAAGAPRLLLAGTVPPDARLHEAVEHGGGCVVAECDEHPGAGLGTPIALGRPALESLALHYQALPRGPRSFGDFSEAVQRAAEASRADAVIFWLIEEDEALAWHLPALSAALAHAETPLLALTRRRWDTHDGALEEITRFTRSLRSRT